MKQFTCSDLLNGDILLYVACPVLTRIVESVSSRSVIFKDGSTMSARTLDIQLANGKFEVTRDSAVIFPE
jgi:hypothetical protein